jgi:hypothetical protein
LVEWENGLGGAQADGFSRHAEDDAGFLILSDCGSPCLFEVQQAGGAVGSHAGQERCQAMGSGAGLDRGIEKDVYRGPLVVHHGAFIEINMKGIVYPSKHHVLSAGRDQGKTGAGTIALAGFLDIELAELIKPAGEGMREISRDMLHDADAGQVTWQGGKDMLKGFGAAGGCTEKDQTARIKFPTPCGGWGDRM